MPVPVASGILRVLAVYLVVGALLLPWLYRRVWPRAAPGAQAASWGFFVVALPGTLLLWPILIARSRHPVHPTGADITWLRNAQTILVALAGAVVIAAILFGRLTRRPPPVMDALPAGLEVPR